MNFKLIIILVVALTVSACGHMRGKDTSAIDPAIENTDGSLSNDTDDANLATSDGGSITLSEAELEAAEVAPSVTKSELGSPSADIFARMRDGFSLPDLDSKHVAEYEKWNASHPTYLENLFKRATPFLFHVVEELEKRGLPMELALLPAVESAYRPEAVSRSSAVGLWQFVPATGREFGLHDDWWYDGRRDPLASTKAALDYLEQLNRMFDGDWFLTLAAYNAGPGTVRRAMKRHRTSRQANYSSISLRSETRRYVPKLIALKNIIEHPERFKVSLEPIASQPYFEVLELPGQVDLNKFAADANIDIGMLRHLNAGFKRWATSPDGPHRLLVPIGDGELIAQAKEAIARAPEIRFKNHRIRQGDTLSGIARQYGVSVASLRKANQLRNNNIRADRTLMVPVRGSSAVIAALAPANQAPSQVVHNVKRGDTLWSIARRYKVRVQELLTWNNLKPDHVLRLNQPVIVVTQRTMH
ncbi:LysM peptidoglycan-binding domain-containing protein [Arenicella xantha]|uniref:Membrane-bound lytic murein transglycosylase D n=1 Tax=Arenicella xantha TaxID=644221 RepID=A0A395JM03_9GAMM|nr:LysM peptidoglycan-binding domain-containing protein [Arenicella xantha]RBP51629.1 membrane-bound lytic murein transglycosylase D [Arenicella xantha]